jgi:hypothetical protein
MRQVSLGSSPVYIRIIDRERSMNVVRLRVYLTLALALLLLGSGAWTPASHTAASDSLDPAGLTAIDWQAIQSQVAKLTAADGVMRAEVRNSVAVSGDTTVVLGSAHVGDISMRYKAFRYYWYDVFADIQVLDQAEHPVDKATVYIEWTLGPTPWGNMGILIRMVTQC